MNSADPVSDELATMLSRCTTCRSWAEQDEGPYHRVQQQMRRDITEDHPGIPLQLGIRLVHEDGTPARETVEVWHCDAFGRYSGFAPPDASTVVTADTAPPPVTGQESEHTFLRGAQPTDAAGMVEFRTIYPGWYPGRTVHIHLIVHVDGPLLTSQLYFPDSVNDEVLAQPPYTARPGRDTTNVSDTIFPTGGTPMVLDVEAAHFGYRAGVCLVLAAMG